MADFHTSVVNHFAQVGMTLSFWEACEGYLADIYQILCESENQAPLLSYGAIVSATGRFEILELAIGAYFTRPTPLLGKLKALLRRAKELSGQRNKVTHSTLLPSLSGEHKSIPSWYQSRRYKGGTPTYLYSTSEIETILRDTVSLMADLKAYLDELRSFDERRRKRRSRQ